MANKVFYEEEARQKVLAGAKILYDAVKTTLGVKGRNVIIQRPYGTPSVTHDGVTVARAIEIEDDESTLGQKVGVELIKQASSKMGDSVGDGTTTVTVLTYHILSEANKLITAGHNPMLIRKGLEQVAEVVLKKLDELSENIKDNKARVTEVATISAGDKEIGKLIADVIEKVGRDGSVSVEQGQGLKLESEIVEGFTFDKGFVSPYMATDNSRMEAVYEKPAIVITDKKVSSIQEFVPLIEKIAQSGKKDLVLIAEDIDGEALTTFVVNKLKGTFNTVAVKAPAFGDNRKEILLDIATLTSAKVISAELNEEFKDVEMDSVGSARKVIVTKDETTIIEGAGSLKNVNSRVEQVKSQIETAKNDYEKDTLKNRLASILNKVAVIKVGGATETEINEKKDRVDDAVHAVKAAVKGGIVAGGGVTLINLASSVSDTSGTGEQLLLNALEQPFRILLKNAGFSPDVWLSKIKESDKIGQGVDVSKASPQLVDLKSVGVIDPTLVTKEAIQNAVSIAGTALTMGALVVTIPEKEAPQQPPMGMM